MLTLPGKILDISALNNQHKFRDRGKKQGAVDAIEHLQETGLGVVHKERATRGTSLVSIRRTKAEYFEGICHDVARNPSRTWKC